MATDYPLADLHPANAEPNDKKCPELQLLEHAISNCAVPLVHQLIQQHPKVVFEKGWHGQTPLHKACLVGDWSIVFLLLEAGSDPNALNEFEETPLHYACKRGVGSVVNLLIQRGGNLEAIDKNGMRVVHHAAQTGSIFVFHLLAALNVDFTTVDRNLQTPLHIACKHGHVETFKFLMKKGRSNILQADLEGNNALHIAAIEGHSYLCWVIMSMTTCSTLHVFNRCGLTPRKLAEQRDTFGHKEIIPLMKYYETVDRTARPGGPISLWWGHFYVPGLYYALLVLFAAWVGGWYQGFIVTAGMAFLLLNLIKHTHRMVHVCRWPNPVYAGTFTAGILHTVFVVLYKMMPSDCKDYIIFTIVFLSFGVMLFYYFWKVIVTDPGTVTQSICDKETGRPMTVKDLCLPQSKMESYCVQCEIVRHPKTKHCKLCERCYDYMDHHCLFLLKCVARNNHSLFCWFIIIVLICMFMFLFSVYIYCTDVYNGKAFWEMMSLMFTDDAWILSMTLMNVVSIFWGLNLIKFQFGVVSKGQTTYYNSKRQSVLTKSERLLNIVYFLMGRRPFAEDPLFCADLA